MKQEITIPFARKVLKLDTDYKVKYCAKYINIEVLHIPTKKMSYINIHEFIHTHCRDYLLSYANGLKTTSETKFSNIDKRIPMLSFDIHVTVPNLVDGDNVCHTEIFTGLSELMLYVNAVEWLMKYREDNPKLSKFWINKF